MSNFPCPECGAVLRHAARSCACGWGSKGARSRPADDQANAQYAAERKQMLATMEAVATDRARAWLEENRIVARSVTGAERREKLRAYIARLKTQPKPGPRDWAYTLLSRIIDGEHLPQICEQFAREVVAMGEVKE